MKKILVLDAAISGRCNTSRDVSEETGLPINVCASYVGLFVRLGILRRTNRYLPSSNPVGRGRPFRVFEVVA